GVCLAYVRNEHGNTALVVLDMIGGKRTPVTSKRRKQKLPQAQLTIGIRDGGGRAGPARGPGRAGGGAAHPPEGAWMHADDRFDRGVQRFETQYFHCATPCSLDVPAGKVSIDVQHG